MKKYLFTLLLICSLWAPFVSAETATTGFVSNQIWYSKNPLVAGETVNIYTAIWNGSNQDISAKVSFYDGKTILGTRDVIVPKSQLKDVSVSWNVTAGDHIITAKITSSTVTTDGKKTPVTISNTSTEPDRQFVEVNIRKEDGVPISSAEVVKSKVAKTTSEIESVIPASVDEFRLETYTAISKEKIETQKELDVLEKKPTETNSKTPTVSKPLDGVQKPIAYVKLFLLSAAAFIFGNKIIFYGLCALIVFLILRFIYRKIRNR